MRYRFGYRPYGFNSVSRSSAGTGYLWSQFRAGDTQTHSVSVSGNARTESYYRSGSTRRLGSHTGRMLPPVV